MRAKLQKPELEMAKVSVTSYEIVRIAKITGNNTVEIKLTNKSREYVNLSKILKKKVTRENLLYHCQNHILLANREDCISINVTRKKIQNKFRPRCRRF